MRELFKINHIIYNTHMIFFFTDFGPNGPYLGQMQAIAGQSIDLLNNAPSTNPRASAYLLSALSNNLPVGTIIVAVVDPGVGSDRQALVVATEYFTWIGPDNGLLSQVITANPSAKISRLIYEDAGLSSSFHGRDLFTPVAVALVAEEPVPMETIPADSLIGIDWPPDLFEVIYIDYFGNAFTGIRQSSFNKDQVFEVNGQAISYARTFSEVEQGKAFWYYNSCGLVEIAVNTGSAAKDLNLDIGCALQGQFT